MTKYFMTSFVLFLLVSCKGEGNFSGETGSKKQPANSENPLDPQSGEQVPNQQNPGSNVSIGEDQCIQSGVKNYNFVLVFDASSSMNISRSKAVVEAGKTFFGLMEQMLISVEQKPEIKFTVQSAIVKFSEQKDTSTIVPMSPVHSSNVMMQVNGVETAMRSTSGSTDYIAGFNEADRHLMPHNESIRNFIIFLTDGIPREQSFDEVKSYLAGLLATKGPAIYLVGAGSNIKYAENMRQIGNHHPPLPYDPNHRGQFIHAVSGQEISASFANIFANIFDCK